MIDDILQQQPDLEERRCDYVHLYGVSAIYTLLALKRGLDPIMCSAAGILHDIWNYKVGASSDHGPLGAKEARELLTKGGGFTDVQIDEICLAIAQHSNKDVIDGMMAELLKDADVLQHYLYNPQLYGKTLEKHQWDEFSAKSTKSSRLEKVFTELGILKGTEY